MLTQLFIRFSQVFGKLWLTLDLKSAGVTNKEFVEHLKAYRTTMCYAWKKFQDSDTIYGKRTVRSKTIFSAKSKMDGNQQRSVGHVAKDADISNFSIGRIILNDLELTAFRK